ncbi:T9SS type A sorting domain-containing protein [bacterium]|nr:T9SS type A sorting domain-containing protein [bacterium]
MKLLALNIFLLLSIIASAQTSSSNLSYSVIELHLDEGSLYEYEGDEAYSAILIDPAEECEFEIIQENQYFRIKASPYVIDEHLPESFIFLSKSKPAFSIVANQDIDFKLHFYDGFAPIQISHPANKKTADCDSVEAIDQSVWRAGLPEPVPGRTEVEVKHCIIHHSAGSNSVTDYTAAVRAIYILHTETNGWDDIGYNYVIAQNGDLYKGRDPLGAADQDNIQGAHFCSKNSGTMGICLLGNYMETAPSEATISTLKQVLAWKLYKEGLDTYEAYPHPNASSDVLGTVAFHRDGCSTVCPGDSVVLLEEELLFDVHYDLNECRGISGIQEKQLEPLSFYPNPAHEVLSFSGTKVQSILEIRNSLGQAQSYLFDQASQSVSLELTNGVYYIETQLAGGTRSMHKFIIVN